MTFKLSPEKGVSEASEEAGKKVFLVKKKKIANNNQTAFTKFPGENQSGQDKQG